MSDRLLGESGSLVSPAGDDGSGLPGDPLGDPLGLNLNGLPGDPLADPLGLGSGGLLSNALSNEVCDDVAVGFGLDPLAPEHLGLGGDRFGLDTTAPDGPLLDVNPGLAEPTAHEIGYELPEGPAPVDPSRLPEGPADPVRSLQVNRPESSPEFAHENHVKLAEARDLPRDSARDWDWFREVLEEYEFIREHEFWEEDAELNELLDELEESIEGSEQKPFYPGKLDHGQAQPGTGRNIRPMSQPSAKPGAAGKSRRRPWVERPLWRYRPKGPTVLRSRKPHVKTAWNRMRARSPAEVLVDCPVARRKVTGDECGDCEYQNLEKWLENPGEEDPCTHPEYWAYRCEILLESGDFGEES